MYVCTQEDTDKGFNRENRVGKIIVAPLRQNRRVGKTDILPAILPASPFRCRGVTKINETPVKYFVGKKKLPPGTCAGKILPASVKICLLSLESTAAEVPTSNLVWGGNLRVRRELASDNLLQLHLQGCNSYSLQIDSGCFFNCFGKTVGNVIKSESIDGMTQPCHTGIDTRSRLFFDWVVSMVLKTQSVYFYRCSRLFVDGIYCVCEN